MTVHDARPKRLPTRNRYLINLCQALVGAQTADLREFLRVLGQYHTPVTAELGQAMQGAAMEILGRV